MAAAYVYCAETPGSSFYLAFDPPIPNGAQPVTIIADWVPWAETDTTATLQNGSINVTLIGRYWGFEPPYGFCNSVVIGPLPVGTYPVNLFMQQVDHPEVPATLITTTTLTVTPGPSSIPAVSGVGIAALVLLLSVAGWFGLRRRAS
jgi:hypothetical protein